MQLLTYPMQSLWQTVYTVVRIFTFQNLTIVSMTVMRIELCLLHYGIFNTLTAFRWIEIYINSLFSQDEEEREKKDGINSVIEVFGNSGKCVKYYLLSIISHKIYVQTLK